MGILYVALHGAAICLATGGAILLAYEGKEGWGWFIVLALLLGGWSFKQGDVK